MSTSQNTPEQPGTSAEQPTTPAPLPSQALERLGEALPAVATPLGAYRPAVRDGEHILTSGQLPLRDGAPVAVGRAGAELSTQDAAAAARQCALNAIAAAAAVAGDVDALAGVVKVTGFVNSDPSFTDQALVLNGASELLGEVFGEAGIHARSAVGVAALPLGVPVEVEVTFRAR